VVLRRWCGVRVLSCATLSRASRAIALSRPAQATIASLLARSPHCAMVESVRSPSQSPYTPVRACMARKGRLTLHARMGAYGVWAYQGVLPGTSLLFENLQPTTIYQSNPC
jgi:hypothetical protein